MSAAVEQLPPLSGGGQQPAPERAQEAAAPLLAQAEPEPKQAPPSAFDDLKAAANGEEGHAAARSSGRWGAART